MKKLPIKSVAKQWIELKAQEKETEKALKALKPALEDALKCATDKTMELHGWRFTLVEFVKENFSLVKAKEKIDGRTLAPFITESTQVQIRTSWQGGEEEAA